MRLQLNHTKQANGGGGNPQTQTHSHTHAHREKTDDVRSRADTADVKRACVHEGASC